MHVKRSHKHIKDPVPHAKIWWTTEKHPPKTNKQKQNNNKQKPQAATHKITATKTQEALKAWESCDFFYFSQILWAL